MASTLASLCLSQRQTFRTYAMTANLFPLYLMNFMFHTMFDAAGIVLRVDYQSMKCDVLFSQVAYVHYLGEVEIFSYMSTKISSCLQQCKNYKNRSRFPKVMITNVLPPFLWFTVYITSTIIIIIISLIITDTVISSTSSSSSFCSSRYNSYWTSQHIYFCTSHLPGDTTERPFHYECRHFVLGDSRVFVMHRRLQCKRSSKYE